MKVLLATFWSYPLVSGVSSYLDQLKHGLKQRGHEVDVFAHGHGSVFHLFQKKVLHHQTISRPLSTKISDVYRTHGLSIDPWIRKYEVDRYSYELAALYFNLSQYDLIHTQDVVSTYAMARVKPKHVPLVATIHGCFTRESGMDPKRNPLFWNYYATLEQCGASSSDVTLTPTHWLKNMLVRDFCVPRHHITVVPYGIDIRAFSSKASEPSDVTVPANKTIIVCSARLSRVKGHLTLIEALHELKKRRTDWLCLLLGDGSLRKQLEQNCKLYNLHEHVMFMGNRKDVPAILQIADIFVLPSLFDNHPYAVMEAHVAGMAVVATDAGGIPEMVSHGETGLISPRGHSHALAQNIERLLRDKPLRHQLARNARMLAKTKWEISNMLKRIETIYRNVLLEGGDHVNHQGQSNVSPFSIDLSKLGGGSIVWQKIISALPENYSIPDPHFIQMMKEYQRIKHKGLNNRQLNAR